MGKPKLNINGDQKESPKPIFTIGIPGHISSDGIRSISKEIEGKFSDYNILTYASTEINTPIFNAYYPKDFNEVSFEELKIMVLNKIATKP